MTESAAPQVPPFCPNPSCRFHRDRNTVWRFTRAGFFSRQQPPHQVQRYRCCHCRRHFSDQTFRTSYWLKRPDLLPVLIGRLLGCSAYRQIARELQVSPQTVALQAERLGRHALLFHLRHRPPSPVREPLCLDSFISFEWSQFYPTAYHVAVGQDSHFFHGFLDSELRRSGRMTQGQRRRRAALEAQLGRPDPRATERDCAALLAEVAPTAQALELWTDEHTDYPLAVRRLPHLSVTHRTISSRAARTARNPLFPVNLLDLLVRHSEANHKRETIAFSKRRQSAIERLWLLLVWRNYMKSFSERKRDASPAMRLGVLDHRVSVPELLARRLFPSRFTIPLLWRRHYWREVPTRAIPRCRRHQLAFAA